MSRSGRAITALGFGFARYIVVIVAGFVVMPLALTRMDSTTYAQWLVSVEVLSYLGFAELGVGTLLPMLVAMQHGRQDLHALRQLMADARGCCLISASLYLAAFAVLWLVAPDWIGLSGGPQTPLGGAVLIVAGCTSVSFVGRLHIAALQGLQDFWFLGIMTLTCAAIGVSTNVLLLLYGAGPIALAAGLTLPMLLESAVATCRLATRGPGLVRGLPHASRGGMRRLTAEAGAAWLGGVGGRLTLSSNALLIRASHGSSLDVIRFICTSKLGDLLIMQSWQIVDSGIIGLAQLHGEGRRERVSQIISLMERLALVAVGGIAIIMLGFNAAFVDVWLGADKFGGSSLNGAITFAVFGLTIVHVLSVTTATLGHRVAVGTVNFAHGIIYAATAIGMGILIGPLGVAVAGGLVAIVCAAPALRWLRNLLVCTRPSDGLLPTFVAWIQRASGPITLAALLGISPWGRTWWIAAPVTASIGACYAWIMRPLLIDLPLPQRMLTISRKLRLLPTPTP